MRCDLESTVRSEGFILADRILGEGLEGACRLQAVFFEDGDWPGGRAADLLEVLLYLCRRDGTAQCLFLCNTKHLHGLEFKSAVRARGLELEEAFRRVHIKYVSDPSSVGEGAPVVDLACRLQGLSFTPTLVAVLGLGELTRCGPPKSRLQEEGVAHGAAFVAAAGDAQRLVLALMLLVDAASQSVRWSGQPCGLLLWDSVQACRGRGLVCAALDDVWSARLRDGRCVVDRNIEGLRE